MFGSYGVQIVTVRAANAWGVGGSEASGDYERLLVF